MTDPLGPVLIAKATLVLLLALATVVAMRRARAARRALVLAAAFAVLLALPMASLVAPPVGIALPASQVSLSLDRVPVVVQGDAAAAPHPVNPATSGSAASSQAPQRPTLPPVPVLRAVWAAGVVLALVPLLVTLWRLRTLARTALVWTEGTTLVDRLRLERGIRRHVGVGMHEHVDAPLTLGLLNPTVLFPPDARHWTEHDLQHALVHELEHIRRLDWLVYLVARTVCALYWFHPLVWTAWRRLCLETERACDDAVVARSDGETYARQLVSLAQRLSASRPLVGMASRTDLAARVRAILNRHQTRGRAGRPVVAGIACSACLLLVLIGPLRATVPTDRAYDAPAASVQSVPGATLERAAPSAVAVQTSQMRTPGAGVPTVVGSIRRSAPARRSPPGHGGAIERLPDGRIVARDVTIFELVRFAYGLDSRQPIAGARDWADQRFDIEIAPAPGVAVSPRTIVPPRLERQPSGYTVLHAPLDAGHSMVQALLEERFQLDVQFASYQFPRYRVARVREGVTGPNLRPSTCNPTLQSASRFVDAADVANFSQGIMPGGVCGVWWSRVDGATGGRIAATGASMDAVIGSVWRLVRGDFMDDTGLSGRFDFEVRFEPRQPGQSTEAWLAAAIEPQLGLRLVQDLEPLEVLEPFHVLDGVRIERVVMPAGVR